MMWTWWVRRSSRAPARRSDLKTWVPLVEGQVGGNEDGTALVALAEDFEEEFHPGGGPVHEGQFVDDEEFEAGQLALEVEQPGVIPGFHEFAHQGGGALGADCLVSKNRWFSSGRIAAGRFPPSFGL